MATMVDFFAIGLTHALMALAVWKLVLRDDLDADPETEATGSEAADA